MKDGINRLREQYTGSNVFINKWLKDYHLFTRSQRYFFWSYILCVATKIKQIEIELENQLVTIPFYKAYQQQRLDDL